jgi:hypothetical protein
MRKILAIISALMTGGISLAALSGSQAANAALATN